VSDVLSLYPALAQPSLEALAPASTPLQVAAGSARGVTTGGPAPERA
jgi:hypothetical protein